MMGLGPPTIPTPGDAGRASVNMRNARSTYIPLERSSERLLDDRGGTALFYTMSGMFFSLFLFALWYCPRHL
jgi:hypothetical protein